MESVLIDAGCEGEFERVAAQRLFVDGKMFLSELTTRIMPIAAIIRFLINR